MRRLNLLSALTIVLSLCACVPAPSEAAPPASVGTVVPVADAIRDKDGRVWTIVDRKIACDGVVDNGTGNVDALAYIGDTLYQTAYNRWWKRDGNAWVEVKGSPIPAPKPAPKPTPGPAAKVYNVSVGGDIQKALDAAKPGQTVTVAPGALTKGFTVPDGVTLDLTGSTFDGKGAKAIGLIRVNAGAAIYGGRIFNFRAEHARLKTTVIMAGDNASLRNVTLEDWHAGTPVSWDNVNRPTFIDCTIRNTAGSAFLGGGSGDDGDKTVVGPVFDGCTFDGWNIKAEGDQSGIGIMKITRTSGTVFTGCTFENGRGQAIWFDINNRKFNVTGNTFRNIKPAKHSFDAMGVCVELNPGDGSVIEGNTFEGFTKAPTVSIEESSGVTIRGNRQNAGAYAEIRNMIQSGGRPRTYGYWVTENGTRVQKFVPVYLRDITFENNDGGNWTWASGIDSTTKVARPDWYTNDFAKFLRDSNIVYRNNK
ncbi:MAG TPA: right-handed parallel beta-helix repeat-containing protein [Tepidisphaeraceae bacterium]|jgi:hypothetical protein|nr:right-handed parallel beta-helix repeat-containing protein [Tepidisphaeraceae bacterium]